MRHALVGILTIAIVTTLIALGIFYAPRDLTDVLRSPLTSSSPSSVPSPLPTETRAADALPRNTTGFPLRLPPGFSISIFAEGLGAPRVMAWDPAGNLLTSITSQGKIVAVRDRDGDGFAENVQTVLSGLENPHGIALYCATEPCTLSVAETDQVAVYDYDAANARATNKKRIADLPAGGGHFTRTLLFMPYPDENTLLISVGSSCNVCNESDSRRAKILAYDVSNETIGEFAAGLRNAVFMSIHPVTGKVWTTEMGRDWLGDDLPPDEINIIEKGKDYGWPYCYGKNVFDKTFQSPRFEPNPDRACQTATPSHIDIPAHSAPLGLAFFPEEGWPQEYWHNLLVAYHGSWNRSAPTGYKIVRYKLDENGNEQGVEDFITGWLTSSREVLGRPVDILVQPGGIIYISDDKAGMIYRVTYRD